MIDNSEMRKNGLTAVGLVMGAAVTIMSYFLQDKTLFIALATLWVRESVGALMGYYFGASHKRDGDTTNADK